MDTRAAIAVAILLVAGCHLMAPVDQGQGGPDADGDIDGDSDMDSDGDSDGDSDTGTASPPTVWARRAGGPGQDRAERVAVTAEGTIIAVGTFEQTAVFGLGDPNETTLVAAGERDLFLAAFDPFGALLWARRAGGVGMDEVGLALFADGSSVVTGRADGQAVFGPGEPNETALPWGEGEGAFFVAWFGPDGALHDVRATPGGQGRAAAALPDGSVVVAGAFWGSLVLGAGEPGEVTLTGSPGDDRLFVARYGPSHDLVFATAAAGDGEARPDDLVAFPDGSFALAGQFRDTVILGPGEPHETELTAQASDDLLVARFGADGALAWARSETGTTSNIGGGSESARAIGRLGGGRVVVVGGYDYSIVFGAGEPHETELPGELGGMFVAAYEPGGALAWAVRAGRASGQALASAADASGPIYAAGWFGDFFYDTMTFGPDTPGECTLDGAGQPDIGLARYGAGGEVLWARAMGGPGQDELGALAVMPDGSPVLAGAFEGTAHFDLGVPADDTLASAGEGDVFVARLAP
jgi:hypothetical protein